MVAIDFCEKLAGASCEQCSAGYFLSSPAECAPCDKLCEVCKNEATCLSCRYEMLTFRGQCVASCPPGFFDLEKNCAPCFQCGECWNCPSCCDEEVVLDFTVKKTRDDEQQVFRGS